MVGEMLGVETVPIRYEEDGRRHSVVIGDIVDIEVEDFAGAAEGEVMELTIRCTLRDRRSPCPMRRDRA
jgi:hypothetical protein